MITGIDHVVLLAAHLEPAVHTFEGLGFDVVRGGTHPKWGTENALIPLADGFYLELLAPRRHAVHVRHRLWQGQDGKLRKSGQYGGYALETNDVQTDIRAGAAESLEFHTPARGVRQRPDGVQVSWLLADSNRPELPFLVEDQTPRTLRVPAPTGKLNARTRLAAVLVAVSNLAEASQAYTVLLQRPAMRLGSDGGTFSTGRGRIELVRLEQAPGNRSEPGPVAVRLSVAGGPSHALSDVIGGAVLDLVADNGG